MVVGSVSSTAPSLIASSGGVPSSLTASHRHEPQQPEQQLQHQPIPSRRESLDETAITNHTHSSASHFSSSTSGSSSTFTTTTTGSNSSSNNIHDTTGKQARIFRPLSSSSSRIDGSNNVVAMTTNTTFKNGISDEVVATTSPKHNNSHGISNDEENTANSLSSSIISYTKSSSSSERILRYGETIDSLFCLLYKTNDCEEEEEEGKAYEKQIPQSYHRNLCHEICLGSRGNDAFAWVEALELSLNKVVSAGVTREHAGGGDEEEEGKERISDVGECSNMHFH